MGDGTWQASDDPTSAADAAKLGGAGIAGWVAGVGGLSSTNGLLQVSVDANTGAVTRSLNKPKAAVTCLQAGAAVASGAAAFSQAAGPGGAIAGTALSLVANAVQGGITAYSAQSTIAELQSIEGEVENLGLGPGGFTSREEREHLLEALEYCIGKTRVKRNKAGANASIVGQPLTALYSAGKAVYKFAKGTKGVHREQYAREIVEIAKRQGRAGEFARRIIKAVMDQNYEELAKNALADAMKSS